MTNTLNIDTITGERIYHSLLSYGNECFSCGITFQQIKSRLIADGLFEEGQPEEPLLQLLSLTFTDSFETCSNPDKSESTWNCDNFDHEHNCRYYLSRWGCMDFSKLAESKNNRVAADENRKAAADNLKSAKTSVKVAIFAAVIAGIAFAFQLYSTINSSDKEQLQTLKLLLQENQELHSKLLEQSLQQTSFLDSISRTTHHDHIGSNIDTLKNLLNKNNHLLQERTN